MTPDEAKNTANLISDLFPGMNEVLAVRIMDSILPLDMAATEQAAREQHATRTWFDLPKLLKRVRELTPQHRDGKAADQIHDQIAAAKDEHLARRQAEKAQADASFADVLSLPDEELNRLRAEILKNDKTPMKAFLMGREVRKSPTLLALIQDRLRRERGTAAGQTHRSNSTQPAYASH